MGRAGWPVGDISTLGALLARVSVARTKRCWPVGDISTLGALLARVSVAWTKRLSAQHLPGLYAA